jgi:glycerol uptake facilitator-like aquaporin
MIARPILLAEALGTGVLLAVIVGSGWAVEQLGAAPATQLFIHAVVVGAGLGVAIAVFLPISGAQFNPAVTLALLARRELEPGAALQIMTAQLAGGIGGLIVANLMFASELMAVASIDRGGVGRFVSEVFATFGLVLVILLLVDAGRRSLIPVAVGAWVTTIIVATVSTGFANPVVTIARVFTDSYTGIEPGSVAPFIVAQLLGAVVAVGAASAMNTKRKAANV